MDENVLLEDGRSCSECCDEEEVTIISMSPDEGNTYFPSRPPSTQQPQQRHMNGNDRMVRSSRESVLQKLCDALLRRSLTKVRSVGWIVSNTGENLVGNVMYLNSYIPIFSQSLFSFQDRLVPTGTNTLRREAPQNGVATESKVNSSEIGIQQFM
jgi:hypothetical protein